MKSVLSCVIVFSFLLTVHALGKAGKAPSMFLDVLNIIAWIPFIGIFVCAVLWIWGLVP